MKNWPSARNTIANAELVGREHEQLFFEARLDDAGRRDGSTVLLYGEAGLGKTRLLAAWTAAARARAFNVAQTTNYAFATQAYAAVAEACRMLARNERRAQPRGGDRALLLRFLDLFTSEGEAADAPWLKRRLFVVVREFLERLSAYAPVLVTIDDAQWLDPESLEMLQYVAASLAGSRFILVLAARSEIANAATVEALGSIERLVSTYRRDLGPLPSADVRELALRALPAGSSLAQRVVDDICRRSDGNPLFALDLVRDALAEDSTTGTPSGVKQSATARVARLPPHAVPLIEIAAVLGSEIDVTVLRAVWHGTRAEEVAAFRAARELGLLVDGGPQGPRFRHALIREAVYERLTALERRELHERIAQTLETQEPPAEAAVLAWHWGAAGDADRTARFAERAGDVALTRFAFATARDHFEIALASGALDDDATVRICEKLGNMHDLLGSAREAYERFSHALAHYRRVADRPATARVSLRLARCAHRLADAEATMRHCRDALATSEAVEPEWHAARALLGMYHAYRGEVAEATEQLVAADRFTGVPDPGYVVRRHIAGATVANLCGRFDESERAATAAVRAAEAFGDPAILANAWALLGDLARTQANFRVARNGLDHAIDVADAFALTYTSAYARLTAADMAFLSGDLERAHRLLRFACALQVESVFLRFYASAIGIPIALAVEDERLLERLEDEGLLRDVAQTAPDQNVAALAAAHAELRAARGDAEGAATLIAQALARLGDARYLCDALLKCARFGSPGQARQAHAAFRRSEICDVSTEAHALLVEAIVNGHDGDAAARNASAARARTLADGAGLLTLKAIACELEHSPSAALQLYETIGATRDARRLSGRPAQAGSRASGELTPREREVAELVASGLPNRSIAERLKLSNRTVEHHLASVFSKVDVRSRTELATLMARTASAPLP